MFSQVSVRPQRGSVTLVPGPFQGGRVSEGLGYLGDRVTCFLVTYNKER